MANETRTEEPKLAAYLARKIFEAPTGVGTDRTQRIAFKGGRYPGKETDLGGLCEDALIDVIEAALQEYRK